MDFQTINFEGGQTGFFFGNQDDLVGYISAMANKKRAIQPILTTYNYLGLNQLVKLTPTLAYNRNVAAIKMLADLENGKVLPTHQNLQKLAQYAGWGFCTEVFNANQKPVWLNRNRELQQLLNGEDYQQARATTPTAFFTPDYLSAAIYKGIAHNNNLGGRFLETSAGVGGLVRSMSASQFNSFDEITLIERDPTSARMLKQLYPSANVLNTAFQDAALLAPQSLIIQNPPFADVSVFDGKNRAISGFTLHNYFLSKSASLLAQKGWMIAIVTTSFLDSKTKKAREYVASQATLKAALRLPKEVFCHATGANASVDLLVFEQGEDLNPDWVDVSLESTNDGDEYQLNNYFLQHPENIIGEMAFEKGMHGKQIQCLFDGNINNLVTLVENRVVDLFKGLTFAGETVFNAVVADVFPTDAQQGTLTIKDGKLYSCDAGKWSTIKTNAKNIKRIEAVLKVRDALFSLIEKEQTDCENSSLDSLRAKLNKVYDSFVSEFGYIHDTTNYRTFKKDPSLYNLLALEVSYKSGINAKEAKQFGINPEPSYAEKAEIFNARVITPWVAPEAVETAADALVISLNMYGSIDIAYCAGLLGQDESEFIDENDGTLIFNDNGQYVSINQYRAGDVKSKVEQAKINLVGELQGKYIEALLPVIPVNIEFEEIALELGATWIPAKIYEQFITHLCDGQIHNYTKIQVGIFNGQWQLDVVGLPYQLEREYGSREGFDFRRLLAAIMNSKPLTVSYKDTNGNKIIDKQATLENELNAEKLIGMWTAYLSNSVDIQNELTSLYNERFNRIAPLVADNSVLLLPDSNKQIQLRQHQLNVVYRAITEGKLLLDHAVGSGKTIEIAVIVHELIRLKLKRKAMVVVPNHLVSQMASEWLRVYPQEKLTVLEPDDMTPAMRKGSFYRMKTGANIIICPETSFGTIPVDSEIEQTIIAKEMDALDDCLANADSNENRYTIKAIEKKKERLENRLKELSYDDAKSGDTLLELGVDCLVLDEAHSIKNLQFESLRLANVKGVGNPEGSKRAWNWYMQIQSLKSLNHNRLGVFLATGTPIANSLLEAYVFLRFLNEEVLEDLGIAHLDDWISLFGEIKTDFEINPTGQGFKPVSRLRAFKNLNELQSIWRQIADTVTTEQLSDYLPKIEHNGNYYPALPPITGGAPRQIIVEPTDAQKVVTKELVERAKDFKHSPVTNDNMLLLISDARKSSLDVRLLRPTSELEAGNKLPTAAQLIADKYFDTAKDKGVQIVFCDLGVPNGAGFCTYNYLSRMLQDYGVEAHEIAFAQSYKTPAQRKELYNKLNNGIIRIIVASTATLGTGANINKRLVAIHLIDPCLRPCDMQQRMGRGIRQGSLLYQQDPSFTLDINFYATKEGLDSWLYQTLETKAKFIDAFRNGKAIGRKLEMDSSLSYAEIKAQTSGDTRVLEMVYLTKTIQRLDAANNAYIRERRRALSLKNEGEINIPALMDKVNRIEYDNNHIEALKGYVEFNSWNGQVFTKMSDCIAALEPRLGSLGYKSLLLGTLCGFELKVRLTDNSKIEIQLIGRETYLSSVKFTPSFGRMIIKQALNILKKHGSILQDTKDKLTRWERTLSESEITLKAENQSTQTLTEAKQRLIELKAELNGIISEAA